MIVTMSMAYNSPTSEDRSTGKRWGHGTCWSDEEIQFVRDHQDSGPTEIGKLLGRPRASVYGLRKKLREEVPREDYAVQTPGLHVEYLHAWVAEDFELSEIWMRWNGYSSFVIADKDAHQICTLTCTAK